MTYPGKLGVFALRRGLEPQSASDDEVVNFFVASGCDGHYVSEFIYAQAAEAARKARSNLGQGGQASASADPYQRKRGYMFATGALPGAREGVVDVRHMESMTRAQLTIALHEWNYRAQCHRTQFQGIEAIVDEHRNHGRQVPIQRLQEFMCVRAELGQAEDVMRRIRWHMAGAK